MGESSDLKESEDDSCRLNSGSSFIFDIYFFRDLSPPDLKKVGFYSVTSSSKTGTSI
jgi:hypothetical protein